MKFKYTILYVENVSRTLDFYSSAFNLKQKMLHDSGDYGELDTGNTILSFSSIELMSKLEKSPSAPTSGRPCFEIAFETEDVPNALKKALEAGAKLVQNPESMPWGQITAYVEDLNGYLIEICTPVSN